MQSLSSKHFKILGWVHISSWPPLSAFLQPASCCKSHFRCKNNYDCFLACLVNVAEITHDDNLPIVGKETQSEKCSAEQISVSNAEKEMTIRDCHSCHTLILVKANLFQKGYLGKSENPLFCHFWGEFLSKFLL